MERKGEHGRASTELAEVSRGFSRNDLASLEFSELLRNFEFWSNDPLMEATRASIRTLERQIDLTKVIVERGWATDPLSSKDPGRARGDERRVRDGWLCSLSKRCVRVAGAG